MDKSFLEWAKSKNLIETDKDRKSRVTKAANVYGRVSKIIMLKIIPAKSDIQDGFIRVVKEESLFS